MTNGEKIKEIFPYLTKQMLAESLNLFEWWNAEYKESTTKNDLGVDCISRADARSLICNTDIKHHMFGMSREVFKDLYNGMDELPSVTPQEPFKPMVEIDLYSVIKQKYIEREVLDKIRAEILDNAFSVVNPKDTYEYINVIDLDSIDKILDKYKAETEDNE